jgi:hypothetical protein
MLPFVVHLELESDGLSRCEAADDHLFITPVMYTKSIQDRFA